MFRMKMPGKRQERREEVDEWRKDIQEIGLKEESGEKMIHYGNS